MIGREQSIASRTILADSSNADHVLGRPSSQFRKVQVFAVVSFWSFYLLRSSIASKSFFKANDSPEVTKMALHLYEIYLLVLERDSLPGRLLS